MPDPSDAAQPEEPESVVLTGHALALVLVFVASAYAFFMMLLAVCLAVNSPRWLVAPWVSGPCLLVLPPLPYAWLARRTRLGRIVAATVLALMLALDVVTLVCISTTGAWAWSSV